MVLKKIFKIRVNTTVSSQDVGNPKLCPAQSQMPLESRSNNSTFSYFGLVQIRDPSGMLLRTCPCTRVSYKDEPTPAIWACSMPTYAVVRAVHGCVNKRYDLFLDFYLCAPFIILPSYLCSIRFLFVSLTPLRHLHDQLLRKFSERLQAVSISSMQCNLLNLRHLPDQ